MSEINLAVSGPPRNGTSALRRFLNRDFRIMVLHEANIFGLWDKKQFNVGDRKLKLNLNKKRLDYSGPFIEKDLDIDKFFQHLKGRQLTGAQVLKYLRDNSLATVVGDKNPGSYINKAEQILAIPNTKLIVIVRDGRDAVCSYVRSAKKCIKENKPLAHWARKTPEHAQHVWINSLKSLQKIAPLQETGNLLVTRFEDATLRKNDFMKKVQEFLGLEWHPIIDDARYHAPFGPVRLGIWKDEIPDIMSKINGEFEYYMEMFNYI